ncbi:MAG: hypothetical protein ABI045_04060 [Flavobacteriales bacterium]
MLTGLLTQAKDISDLYSDALQNQQTVSGNNNAFDSQVLTPNAVLKLFKD